MKALLLVGGYGTRLRPFTITKPKPLIEFVNKPMIEHQIAELVKVGVNHIIMAVSYMPDKLNQLILNISEKLKVKITINMENEPLGTAGPIANAAEYLKDEKYFFVFNSDITCEFPLERMLNQHIKSGAAGTIAITKVNEPSKYGVVVYETDTMKISSFVEKPQIFVSNRINAGLYILNNTIIDMISIEPTSIEKQIFPVMAKNSTLYAFNLEGHWMDIGQPKDFILGTSLYLEFLASNGKINRDKLPQSNEFIGNVHVDDNVHLGNDVKIGPNVVIGKNVTIGKGVCIKNSTILPGCTIGDFSMIHTCIIGWKSKIGKWVRLENNCFIGENVKINDELCLNDCIIFPHKVLNESTRSKIILDIGSHSIKAGVYGKKGTQFNSDNNYCYTCPSVVGTIDKSIRSLPLVDKKVYYVGADIERFVGILSLKHAVKRGVIVNECDFKILLNHIFEKLEISEFTSYKIMVSEPVLPVRMNRDMLAKPVLAMYASGESTGLFIDVGDAVLQILPIYRGVIMPMTGQKVDLGGQDVTKLVANFVRPESSFKSVSDLKIANEIKEKSCFVPLKNITFSKSFTEDENLAKNIAKVSLHQYNGSTIPYNILTAPNVFFEPCMIGLSHPGIDQLLENVIMACDREIRQELISNVVFTGGSMLIKNFKERMKLKLCSITAKIGNVKIHQGNDAIYSTFIGAFYLCGIEEFNNMWIEKSEYLINERVMKKKCFFIKSHVDQ